MDELLASVQDEVKKWARNAQSEQADLPLLKQTINVLEAIALRSLDELDRLQTESEKAYSKGFKEGVDKAHRDEGR